MLDRCSPQSYYYTTTSSFAASSSSSSAAASAAFTDRLRLRQRIRYAHRQPSNRHLPVLINFIPSQRRRPVLLRRYCYRANSQPVDGSAAAAARSDIDPLLQPLLPDHVEPAIDGAAFMSRSDIESCQWLLPAAGGNNNEVDLQKHVHQQQLREPAAGIIMNKSQQLLEPSADAADSIATTKTSASNYGGAHRPFPAAIPAIDHEFEKRNAISSAYGCCFGPSYAAAAAPALGGSAGLLDDAVPFQFDFSSAAASPDHGTAGTLLPWQRGTENGIERAIFDFRFFSLLAVAGSLVGAFLCFLKGCVYIMDSYAAFYHMFSKGVHTGMVVLRLVEAVDVYLTGTVMLIFGMGLYGLFISNVSNNLPPHEDRALRNSSLFGMFILRKRPKWMRIASLDELKSKLGHVVVMILLVKMFERSKAICIATSVDLLTYSICIFLISSALLVLRNISHHDH